jgi:pSer/pThr/pTyr-binding forkhead associated (FHA) protein
LFRPSPDFFFLSITIEPTENWTVDQVLQWWLWHAQSETDAARDEFIDQLQSQLDQGKHRLWNDHEQVVLQLQKRLQQPEAMNDASENVDPQQQQQLPSSSLSVGPTKTSGGGSWKEAERDTTNQPNQESTTGVPAPTTTSTSNVPAVRLMVEIVGGEYEGKIIELNHLTPHEPAVIGRSRSKKVLKYGISLPKDPEVSTTHARFLVKGGGGGYSRSNATVYFIDDGSTNGSMVNGQFIQKHVDIPLESGMEIQVGGTIMLVTF